ncbi:hypothetical protein HID58_011222, partial [Brassica napus]
RRIQKAVNHVGEERARTKMHLEAEEEYRVWRIEPPIGGREQRRDGVTNDNIVYATSFRVLLLQPLSSPPPLVFSQPPSLRFFHLPPSLSFQPSPLLPHPLLSGSLVPLPSPQSAPLLAGASLSRPKPLFPLKVHNFIDILFIGLLGLCRLFPLKDDLPLVGNKAPDFEAEAVFDQEFIKVKLSEYIGKKYVILFFYPLDFTFVCPTEITAFSDRYAEFEKLNTEVLGVSVDSVFSHLAWVQTDRKSGGLGDLNYPLISDVTKSISKSFGVLIHDQGIALRGLFIIDKEGVIQHSTINNLGIGRSVDETMRTLQALQYIQENPDEVCPAGWKPGEKSMKPDPKLSKEYFSAI